MNTNEIKQEVISSLTTHLNTDVEDITNAFISVKDIIGNKDLSAFVIRHNARRTLPYGIWKCRDGREVIFNREYQPMIQRKDGVDSYVDKNLWVEDIITVTYLYTDITSPMWFLVKQLDNRTLEPMEYKACKKSLLICIKVLRDYTPKERVSVSRTDSLANLF